MVEVGVRGLVKDVSADFVWVDQEELIVALSFFCPVLIYHLEGAKEKTYSLNLDVAWKKVI